MPILYPGRTPHRSQVRSAWKPSNDQCVLSGLTTPNGATQGTLRWDAIRPHYTSAASTSPSTSGAKERDLNPAGIGCPLMIVGDGQRLTEVNIGRRDAVELQKLRRQSVSGRSRWLALRLDWWTMVLFSLKGGLISEMIVSKRIRFGTFWIGKASKIGGFWHENYPPGFAA